MTQQARPFRPHSLYRVSRALKSINHRDAVLLAIALFFASGLARGQPLAAEQPGTGGLVFEGQAATQLSTSIDVAIVGIVATVTVEQAFRNDTARWMGGQYAFPLPPDAAVNRLELRIGERRIEGEIQEKQAAEATFAAAQEAGQTASLVGQRQANRFTTAVTHVPPGETVVVTLSYLQTIAYDDEQFRFSFPTAFTPPYERPSIDPAMAMPALGPPPGFDLRVRLAPGFTIAHLAAPHHSVDVQQQADEWLVSLVDDPLAGGRDFELVWEPLLGRAPQAALLRETTSDGEYGLLMMLPPRPEFADATPRELILVIDTSGSMGGAPIRQATESLLMAVGSLKRQDRFNIIAFASNVDSAFPGPVDASSRNVGRALDWIDRIRADGGTEMHPALAAATRGEPQTGYVRQIVFITDGAISGERRLFAQIARDLGDARLFTVGIGSAPNAYFMRKAAEFGRGSYTFIGSENQVAERMDALLNRLEHPVMTDLCVNWPGAAEAFPSELPDLYIGEPLIVAVKLDPTVPKGPITTCGKRATAAWEASVMPQQAHEGFAIGALWARRKVAGLMDDLTLGADPESVREAVIDVALEHRLVTDYTSFVAVDRTPTRTRAAARNGAATEPVVPAAFAGAPLGLPQTDAGTVMRGTLGIAMLLLGWILSRRLRDPL